MKAAMLKKILSKIPRKSKPDSGESNGSNKNLSGNGDSLFERSSTAKRMSSVVFPAASVVGGVEPMETTVLSFEEVPNSEKKNLFFSKLKLCCVVYDFNYPTENLHEKDLKRQTLIELVDFVASGSVKFTESVITALCTMIGTNLFFPFRSSNYRLDSISGGGEIDEEEPIFNAAWSHLQIVYDLLLRFIASSSVDAKVAQKYVDQAFILRLLDLFDSDDPRERDCLKAILHRLYGKFMVHRPFIRKAVSNIFYCFAFETERHNGIAELLEIFGSVISGFALPLKDEHKTFLLRALIPLHRPKSVVVYLQQLSYCISQFMEKDPKLTSSVIRGLLKYWPITNSQKEVMFLGELEEVLEVTNVVEIQKIIIPLFRRIGCCLNSSHFQVAERCLFLCNNDNIVTLIAQNRQVILPLIIPALEKNTRNHWNQTVLNQTLNLRKILLQMDEELIMVCEGKFEEEEENIRAAAERRNLKWEHLETFAKAQLVDCS
ncbi:hypothetical protein GIB67_020524 [Kingdonia uniflora]|uniref:Serine/threonine protein phosphatase 2A regulatory subunit n=1 Tax=Kingdonia uniflora TaxID=39325 RepID=A0A7J7NLT8_9MAGN|nr:hypothetical protein GIB67_020524 [Kingdonia uniflora]